MLSHLERAEDACAGCGTDAQIGTIQAELAIADQLAALNTTLCLFRDDIVTALHQIKHGIDNARYIVVVDGDERDRQRNEDMESYYTPRCKDCDMPLPQGMRHGELCRACYNERNEP